MAFLDALGSTNLSLEGCPLKRISLRLVAVFVTAALLLGLWLGTGLAATTTPAPGSDQDPLVTKSYVDQEIAKLQDSLGEGGGDGSFVPLQVVTVPAGQRLIGLEGTEFILRSGKGKIVGSSAGGIPDLTGAKDLANNIDIPANHLLLIPRSDERGLRATTNLVVMVRGRYEIKP